MNFRMLWFLPIGVVTGMGGLNVSRYLFHQGGKHRSGALLMMILTWSPLVVWLLNQFFNFER